MEDYAICARNLVKHYGNHAVLNDVSLSVEKGVIYGLLGASGCGKTTLLNTILGRKSVESGDIWILGKKIDKNDSNIRTVKVGYMPQDIGLIQEFTISDTINYFGKMYNMEDVDIKKNFDILTVLLDLPPKSRYLKHCSGGQQRRVSLAVALLHKPKLLILDEPTVGLDPLLREKIWIYLSEIVKSNNFSVVITTHYIDECKDADKIGLMRGGRLLAETSPANLLSHFHTDSLETAFLELCKAQDKENDNTPYTFESHNEQILEQLSVQHLIKKCEFGDRHHIYQEKMKKEKQAVSENIGFSLNRMHALLVKNWKQFYRNIGGILFLISFPILQLWFFANSLGTTPINLNVGIVNGELSNTCLEFMNWNMSVLPSNNEKCQLEYISCNMINYFQPPMIIKKFYNSTSIAIDDVKHGKLIGVVDIPYNFSKSYEDRIRLGNKAGKSTLEFGEIKIFLDMSNSQVGTMLQRKLIDQFTEFEQDLFIHCNISKKLLEFPFKTEFYYGNNQQSLTIFMAPGFIVLLTFLLGSTMTSEIIVKERMDGIWERSIIAGTSSLEITLAHLLFQSAIMFFQCIECIVMVFFLLRLDVEDKLCTMFLICYVTGVCGMAFGFFGSSICKTPTEANIMCTGGYLPMTVICGVIWPIEGMPTFLRLLATILPCTTGIESFRNVMLKKWPLWHQSVILGVGVAVIWIILLATLSIIIIKRNK
ncbi:ABC transporter G family member 23-like isoform X1 [Sitophilus oryzae]|uniref:ABC transporter G family member 23-like isoform X1 n=1 Tax=Sitophilus oryzae TaxID=7048 RepID=A0A6J2XHY3_SITOR|nr:ABC transporter G family member 23-like isoform X1 [Sitophilus oryzae]XP_030750300.1 ABC transporter G family member 23-like isoform X1 [Sitophilus oryzae]